MLFAVVKGGKTLSGDVRLRSTENVLLFLSIHSEIKGMLLTAHSFESSNSLFKALATAHGH